MARLCEKCGRCHSLNTACPKKPTLKEIQAQSKKNTAKFLKTLNKAFESAKHSKLRFDKN